MLRAMTSPEQDAVLAANNRLYEAFERRDLAAMDAAWSDSPDLCCVHPGWPPIRGREAVMQSWKAIFENSDSSSPSCESPTCHVWGDCAYVLCRERLGNAILIATNMFTRGDDGWTLVHHHASALARIPDTPPLDPDLLPN